MQSLYQGTGAESVSGKVESVLGNRCRVCIREQLQSLYKEQEFRGQHIQNLKESCRSCIREPMQSLYRMEKAQSLYKGVGPVHTL